MRALSNIVSSGVGVPRLFHIFSIIFVAGISITSFHDAMGESRSAVGLSSSETIALLGFPVEKIERESKRESQWSFFDGRVVLLREGIVVQEEWSKSAQPRTNEQVDISRESSPSEFIFSGNELLSAMKQIEEETKPVPVSNRLNTRSGPPKRRAR